MSPQASIAHYRILSKIGEGGMGTVYRATDTKLSRQVAIKVLPDSFANDPDRLARFTREAQVLASLNHPNIAAIYGVEDRALVMELVEGDTLADRIARGGGPVEEAVEITRQIADALEYAHEKSVIHRDLKPANIKVTPDGKVKVLDFGLAKALTPDIAIPDTVVSPTLTMRATMEFGPPQSLMSVMSGGATLRFSVSPDGQRIVSPEPENLGPPAPATIVVNWQKALKQ